MPLIIKQTGFEDYIDKSGGAFVKCLIMGPPDVGKTRSASFWPGAILMDCEKGRMSVADRRLPYAEITSSQDVDDFMQRLREECRTPYAQRKYQTVVVDTIDSLQQKIWIPERLRAERKESLSGWQDWGYLDAKMQAFLADLLALPMNVVVNVHVEDHNDGDDLIKKPRLKGGIRDQITGDFDLVGHMESSYEAVDGARIRKRVIRWHPEPKFPVLKDRSGRLPRFTEVDFTDEDYWRIFQAILGDGSDIDNMPKQEVIETVGAPAVAPAPPDVSGGPVPVDPATVAPARRTAAKKAAAPKPAVVREEKGGEPETPAETATDVANSDNDVAPASAPPSAGSEGEAEPTPPTMEEAVATVQEALGGTVVEEPKPGDPEPAPEPRVSTAPTCGSQPGQFVDPAKPPAQGCGRSLENENKDKINIALLRTKTFLCPECFDNWKSKN